MGEEDSKGGFGGRSERVGEERDREESGVTFGCLLMTADGTPGITRQLVFKECLLKVRSTWEQMIARCYYVSTRVTLCTPTCIN